MTTSAACWLLAAALAASPPPAAPKPPPEPPLVDVTALIPDLVLDIRYATSQNLLKRPLYPVARCLLRPSVARRLAAVQAELKERGYGLKAFDCYRPFSVQKELWDKVPVRGLVAPPDRGGSHHNRGAAVDVSLVRLDGGEVLMPTDHDDFSRAARVNSPLPPKEAQKNRTLLQQAMMRAGFKLMYMEWWHFEDPDAIRFKTLDIPLDE